MSVADTIQELATDIGNAYDEVQSKGGTIPQNKNTNNLATAIGSIPSGITPTGQIAITQNGTYDVTDYASASVAVSQDYEMETVIVTLDTDSDFDTGITFALTKNKMPFGIDIQKSGEIVPDWGAYRVVWGFGKTSDFASGVGFYSYTNNKEQLTAVRRNLPGNYAGYCNIDSSKASFRGLARNGGLWKAGIYIAKVYYKREIEE